MHNDNNHFDNFKSSESAEKLKKQRKVYKGIWQAGAKRRDMSFLGKPTDWGEPLDKPLVEHVRKVAKAHKEWTGVGADDLHPKDWDALSDGAIQAYIDVWYAAENQGYSGEEGAVLIGIFLPKPTGGFRTVSLMPSAVRIWEALRAEEASKWKLANAQCTLPCLPEPRNSSFPF